MRKTYNQPEVQVTDIQAMQAIQVSPGINIGNAMSVNIGVVSDDQW